MLELDHKTRSRKWKILMHFRYLKKNRTEVMWLFVIWIRWCMFVHRHQGTGRERERAREGGLFSFYSWISCVGTAPCARLIFRQCRRVPHHEKGGRLRCGIETRDDSSWMTNWQVVLVVVSWCSKCPVSPVQFTCGLETVTRESLGEGGSDGRWQVAY